MPLIDLKTDLKSLKFGSNGPYVVKDIENPNPSFIGSKEIYARIDDTIRIGRMLIDKPGLTFAAKQAALIALNNYNKDDQLKQVVKEVGGEVARTLGTILKQVPVNGLGIHFTSIKEDGTYLGSFLKDDQGRLYSTLQDKKPSPLGPGTGLTREESLGAIEDNYDRSNPLSDLKQRQIYGGEPSTLLDSQALALSQLHTQGQDPDTLTFGDLSEQSKKSYSNFVTQETKTTRVVDFRRTLRKDKPTDNVGKGPAERNSYALDYSSTDINKEFRVNLGNPGGRKDRTDYTKVDSTTQDGINMLDVGEGDGQGTGASRDLIKFKFRIITPDSSRVLYFRAHLDSFDDTFNGTWSQHKYIGRAEDFQTYQGFNRSISLGFKIAAMSRQEMKPLYRKMTYLASSTAPTYNTSGDFMRGTFAQVTVGSYIYEMPGVITSVQYGWQTDYPWEVAMQNPEGDTDDDQQELPMIMNATVSFTPIHNFIPKTGLKHYITNPTPANGSSKFF